MSILHDSLKKYICPQIHCDKSYSRNSSLKKHLDQAHKQIAKKYTCFFENCGKEYFDKTSLRNHENCHTGFKPHKCSLCPVEVYFTTKGHLKDHVRSKHNKERLFSCPFEGCGKSFARKTILTVHLRKHTKEKPYKC